jgi:hypothetical protein
MLAGHCIAKVPWKTKMKQIVQIASAVVMTAAVATLSGCSTAGPFVTSISSDGKGNIIVQKSYVHCNGLTGVISTGENPSTEVIRVVPEPAQQQK